MEQPIGGPDQMLTVKQAAALLQMDYKTVRYWVYRAVNPIPHFLPLGNKKQVRIRRDELTEWVERNWQHV